MEYKELRGQSGRLRSEAIFKSCMAGFAIAFGLVTIVSALFWYFGVPYVWLSGVILLAVGGGLSVVFYVWKFKPSAKANAKRIDKLGLDERLLTMNYLEGDDSYIAERQRADAQAALEKVNAKRIKFDISATIIVVLAIAAAFGLGMTSVSVLSAAGVIESGKEIVNRWTAVEKPFFELTYDVKGGGIINGDMAQLIEEGNDASGVLAIADDDWVFYAWSDGLKNPYREDRVVVASATYVAIFKEIDPGNVTEEEDPEEGLPSMEETLANSGTDVPGPSGGGGNWNPSNQVYDGETYYGGSTYENALEDVKEELSQRDDIPDDLKDAIGDYFDTIKQ